MAANLIELLEKFRLLEDELAALVGIQITKKANTMPAKEAKP